MIPSRLALLAIISLTVDSINIDGDNYDFVINTNDNDVRSNGADKFEDSVESIKTIKSITQRAKARRNPDPNWLYCGDTEWCYTTRQDCNLNEDGTGYCRCKPGYKDDDNFCHDDLNECTEVIPHPCFSGPGGGCVDKSPSNGRYKCFCDVGYEGMNSGDNGPTTCIEEDSCYFDPSICGPFTKCVISNDQQYRCKAEKCSTGNPKEIRNHVDKFTQLASNVFPNIIRSQNANPATDAMVTTKDIDLGWEKTGKGFSDWKPSKEKVTDTRRISDHFTTAFLKEDDLFGDNSVSLFPPFPIEDSALYLDSNDSAYALLEDLGLNEQSKGGVMLDSYNLNFDMVSDESFSRIYFQGMGAVLLAQQKEVSRSEFGPFEVDIPLQHLETRTDFRPLGARIHFNKKQKATAIYDYAQETLFQPGDTGWEEAKFLAKVSTAFLITLREHLMWTHIILAQAATTFSTVNLPPSHPIRRLLTVFTFRTTAVNQAAFGILIPELSLLHRMTGVTHEAMTDTFDMAFETSNIYEPFSKRRVNPALRDLVKNGEFPYIEEGNNYYNIVNSFVVRWLEEAGDAYNDKYSRAFYKEMRASTKGQEYKLPTFSKGALIDLLTQIIFVVTAYHEIVGYVIDIATLPDRGSFRVSLDCDENQMDAQSYILTAVLAATTSVRMPRLMNEFKGFFGAKRAPKWEKSVWKKFQEELKSQSARVQAADAERDVKFKHFDPARFECSVSV